MTHEEAAQIVAELKERRQAKRKRWLHRSKLDKHEKAIVFLKQHGATLSDIQFWLKKKRVKVCQSTIHRFLEKKVVEHG